jgi:hypothetical protein
MRERGDAMTTGRERGKQLLSAFSAKVKKEVAPSGEPVIHARGQKAVAELAADLSGPDAPPGLKVFRDAIDRFRVQRQAKNAEIRVEWQRPIQCIVVALEKAGRTLPEVKYVHRDGDDSWHRMEGEGELYEDVMGLLAEAMYPEARRG